MPSAKATSLRKRTATRQASLRRGTDTVGPAETALDRRVLAALANKSTAPPEHAAIVAKPRPERMP